VSAAKNNEFKDPLELMDKNIKKWKVVGGKLVEE
jgi:hypothetical protein